MKTKFRVRERNLPPDPPLPILPPLKRGDSSMGVRDRGTHFSEQKNENETDPVQQALLLAEQLSDKQRKALLDQLALKQQTAVLASRDRDLDMWVIAVTAALVSALGDEDGGGPGPVLIKRVCGAFSVWSPVRAFCERLGLLDLKVVERQAAFAFLVQLLVERARAVSHYSGAPLGPKLVANCSADLAGIFERAFPGYLASGLAGVVVRRMIGR